MGKWTAICIVGAMLAVFGAIAISESSKFGSQSKCKVAALEAGLSAEEVVEVCE